MTRLYGKEEMKELNKMIGSRLREVRKKRNMSLTKLAGAINLTQQQVSKYERGENRVSVVNLVQISRVLSVNPRIFFGGFNYQLNSNMPIIRKALKLTSQTVNLLNSILNHK